MRHLTADGTLLEFGLLYLAVQLPDNKSSKPSMQFYYSEEERKELAKWFQIRSLPTRMAPLVFEDNGYAWTLDEDEHYVYIDGLDERDDRYTAILIDSREGGNLGNALATSWAFTPNEYQELTKRTARYYDLEIPPLAYLGLKLAGEAGEVAEKLGKMWRDHNGVLDASMLNALEKEAGDVLWYVARIAAELDLSLEQVMQTNLRKLQSRLARGVLHGDGDER